MSKVVSCRNSTVKQTKSNDLNKLVGPARSDATVSDNVKNSFTMLQQSPHEGVFARRRIPSSEQSLGHAGNYFNNSLVKLTIYVYYIAENVISSSEKRSKFLASGHSLLSHLLLWSRIKKLQYVYRNKTRLGKNTKN